MEEEKSTEKQEESLQIEEKKSSKGSLVVPKGSQELKENKEATPEKDFVEEIEATFTKEEKKEEAHVKEVPKEESKSSQDVHIFALRTTANREDQVMDFMGSNIVKKGLNVFSVIRPHGMRGYIFLEAATRSDAEQAAFNVPYARGILPNEIQYSEIEHMLEQVKQDVNIQKNDICEIISGPFKREKAKVTRIDKGKEEVVVELLEAAVPIPITVKIDAVKVIRRDTEDDDNEE